MTRNTQCVQRLEEPGPLPPPSRQGERLSRPRAPFLDKCSQGGLAFARTSGLREPATGLAALPPTIRLPTLFHLPVCSRMGGLDPIVGPADSSSTGAMGHAPLVDFCNRYDPRAQPRTAKLRRTPPAVAHQRSQSHDVDLSVAALNCGWRRLFQDAASRDITGQGPRPRQLPRCSAPPTAIARGESFAPTQSARTPPVAARCSVRLETPALQPTPARV